MRLLFFLFPIFLFCQKINTQQIIDSINQSEWKKHDIDFDTIKIPTLRQPLAPQIIIFNNQEDVPFIDHNTPPATPYEILHQASSQKWFLFGGNELSFNQSSFSNWSAGGNNSIGILTKINYNLTYKYRKHFLENILKVGYGMISSKGQSSRKTEDYISYATNYGYEIAKHYYLSTGIQISSQIMPGYNYSVTPNPVSDDRISKFMAPGYISSGIGLSYNPNQNFQAIFRPANTKITIVADPLLQKKGKYGLERDGQFMKTELGAMLHILYKINIYKDIFFLNQVAIFGNYLFQFQKIDFNYNGNIHLRFNKFISANISANILYDHEQTNKIQIKQGLGIGFIYNFGNEEKKKDIKPQIPDPLFQKKNFKL